MMIGNGYCSVCHEFRYSMVLCRGRAPVCTECYGRRSGMFDTWAKFAVAALSTVTAVALVAAVVIAFKLCFN